jgi:lipid A 3-O-deacylase
VRTAAALAALVLLTLSSTPLAARAASPPGDTGVLSLIFENDTFAGTDRYYSSGIRASWQSLGQAPDPLTAAGRLLAPWLLPSEAPVHWGIALGQSIYTSRKTTRTNPPRDDRPYAGWLYGTFALSATTPERLGTAELSLGVIGPASGAKQVQDFAHGLLGRNEPDGWGRQLGNRFAGLLTLERRWQWNLPLGEGLEAGVVPAVGVNVGNVQTAAAAGVMLRLGHGLAMDFGPPRIRPALSGLGVFRRPDGFAGYLFAGVEGRAIAYDGTLEGDTHGYWHVDREPLVAEVPFGFELAYRAARLSATGVLQTKTFDQQSGNSFLFGSVSLSFLF